MTYDLGIIGGGINGVAIARDAALRGLRVILFEKDDFGSGASSKTSKLAHGGLRYLEQLQFRLVQECLIERNLLLKNAPQDVEILPFVLPYYPNNTLPRWKIKCGLLLYDFLAKEKTIPHHHALSSEAIQKLFPTIRKEDLKGGYEYCDALMQDNRLVIDTMLSAEKAGAVLHNHTKVLEVSKSLTGKVNGLVFQTRGHSQIDHVETKIVINATGAWSNQFYDNPSQFQLQPTKGIHLVLPKLYKMQKALILKAPQDNRVFFVIPWNGQSLVGTTETRFEGDPDTVGVSEKEEDYLLTAINHYFPTKNLTKDSLIASFAGLRPLVSFHQSSPSFLSRDFLIHVSSLGLVTVLGGKYTTHRLIAEKVVDNVFSLLKKSFVKSKTKHNLVIENFLNLDNMKNTFSDHFELADRLVKTYGVEADQLFRNLQNNPQEIQQICSYHPHIWGELRHAIFTEKALTLEDWFCRRTSIAYSPCKGLCCLESTARKLGSFLNWNEETLAKAINAWKESRH